MANLGIFKSNLRIRAAVFSSASLFAMASLFAAGPSVFAQPNPNGSAESVCAGDNGGITLSLGFCATVFADNVGHVRHMAVAPNGVLYVNTWSGRYFHNDTPPAGGFLVALKDTKGGGRADLIERFGAGVPEGSAGGSGIAIYQGAVYAEQNDKIIRYALPADSGSIAPKGSPEVILSGLPLTGDHPMHPFAIDKGGHLYVDLGSATNACQLENRVKNSTGHQLLVPNWRRAVAHGAMTPTRPTSISRLRSVMPPASGTARAFLLTHPDGYM